MDPRGLKGISIYLQYAVHILTSPESQIVAQFAGCYVTRAFKYVLLIDDDCALPANFPIVTDRMTDKIKCIGYTIKSVGAGSSVGTIVQQAQDLEYKMSGLQREFAGKLGSATFPHGAISIWDREFLAEAFKYHPGFSVSEDWFLGHVARLRGSRITMCSQVFVETETPTNIFVASGSRGGFGEMTVWTQRFHRWNFFFVSGIWYDMGYILGSWKLGWWEFGAKLFVWQEVVKIIQPGPMKFILLTHLSLPGVRNDIISPDALHPPHLLHGAAVLRAVDIPRRDRALRRPRHHLQRRAPAAKERDGPMAGGALLRAVQSDLNIHQRHILLLVTPPLYRSSAPSLTPPPPRAIFKYAQYFAKRHPKVIDDEKSVEVVVRISEIGRAHV